MSALDAVAKSHSRALLALFVASVLSFLPGVFTIPPVDRDEVQYAQAAKQMAESGDYIDIRFQNEPYYKKPIGIFWLQAASVSFARALDVPNALTAIWVYRMPSLAGAIGAVWLTYWAALMLVTRRAALLAGLLMASCVLLNVEARLAVTDAMLLLSTTAALGALALAYVVAQVRPLTRRERWIAPAVFWTAVAAGVLLKGPVIVLVVGLSIATLSWREGSMRWLTHLRPMVGLLWCSALVLPWLLAIYEQSGAAFVREFAQDFVPGFVRGLKSHAAPPGYFVLVFWLTFWPGSTFVGLAIPAVVRDRRVPGTGFLLAWTVPTWIVCELLVNKLPQYVLPLYPAIAILVAQAVTTRELSRRPWLMRGTIWGVLVPLVVGTLAIGGSLALGYSPGPLAWILIIGAVAISVGSWRRLRRDEPEAALLASVAAALCLSAGVCGAVLPHLRPLFPSATLADVMTRSGCAHPTAVTSLSFQEPSVVFLTGTETRATGVTGAVAFLGGDACRFAFVDAKEAAAFVAEAAQRQVPVVEVTRVDGLNFTKGAAVALVVYQSRVR